MSHLPADCLKEIFEYLEEDGATLRSCLLVNRLWCEVSVRILWRRIRSYKLLFIYVIDGLKEILHENELISSTLISKPRMFNYVSFCKDLSIDEIYFIMNQLLEDQEDQEDQESVSVQDFNNALIQEIFKYLMNQISSLRRLEILYPPSIENFASLPGARDCLRNLSELRCNSDIRSELFYELSQICGNIQLLDILL